MTHRAFYRIAVVLIAAVCAGQQNQTTAAPTSDKEILGPGVTYRHVVSTTPAGEPWSIHVVEIERHRPGVKIRVAPGLGGDQQSEMQRELPTAIAARALASGENVVAVVNGDFDAMPYLGVSLGPSVTSGRLWTAGGKSTWPAFAILKDENAVIGSPHFGADIRAGAKSWHISTFNKSPGLVSGLAIYTREFRASLKTTRPFRAITMEAVKPALPLQANSKKVSAVVTSNVAAITEAALSDGELVLVAPDASGAESQSLAMLKPGQKVELRISLDVDGKTGVSEAIGGFPIIVRNGKRDVLGNPAASHSKRHPRTAVCYNDHEFILAVVDGRQPTLSVGMTLDELADLMVSLGCQEAMNTDGGGSTVMAIAQPGDQKLRIVNSPSDGKERGRGNALLVELGAAGSPVQ